MATNPLYYTRLHSDQVMLSCPSMTRERYMQGYDRANSLVNTMIGVANEVARATIADGIRVIKDAGLYRQRTKQLCNETTRRQEEYERIHNQNFGDRRKLWLDYLDGVLAEYRPHIFNIYMAVKQVLDRHRQTDAHLKAALECGLICAELAVGQFDALMKDLRDEYGVDYSPLFSAGRYDGPLFSWRQLCAIYVRTDDPEEYIDLNADKDLRMAADVLARKLSDHDIINRLGKRTIELNREVAARYADPDDLRELGMV